VGDLEGAASIEVPADSGGDGIPKWRATADDDGHYVFAVAR
jgi:hypothetical protein